MPNTKKVILIFLMISISTIAVFIATSCALRMVSAPNNIEVFVGLGVLLLIAVFIYLFTIKLIKYVNKK